MRQNNDNFDVALSFAGEDREYVEEVAHVLAKMGFRVFYDKYETVSLWGRNLYTHLHEVYFKRARFTVMFISNHYKEKLWTNHERESAQAKAFTEGSECILPARFDDTQIPGVLPTVGYIDLNEYSPAEIAELIKQKIGPVERLEFFPDVPDRLYEYFGRLGRRQKETICYLAHIFFNALKLMTAEERSVLSTASQHACPTGLPDNVHLRLDFLSRLVKKPEDELQALFSRLDCLGIRASVYLNDSHKDENSVAGLSQIIQITFEPLIGDVENATYIMIAMLDCLHEYLCPACVEKALERIDLSALADLTAFDDPHAPAYQER